MPATLPPGKAGQPCPSRPAAPQVAYSPVSPLTLLALAMPGPCCDHTELSLEKVATENHVTSTQTVSPWTVLSCLVGHRPKPAARPLCLCCLLTSPPLPASPTFTSDPGFAGDSVSGNEPCLCHHLTGTWPVQPAHQARSRMSAVCLGQPQRPLPRLAQDTHTVGAQSMPLEVQPLRST